MYNNKKYGLEEIDLSQNNNDFNDYKNKSFAELDKQYEMSVKKDKIVKIFKTIFWTAIILILFPNAFLFWFRFATPHAPKYITNKVIDVSKDPVQIDIKDPKKRFVEYNTLENNKPYVLEKMARYSISGRVVAKNYYFWGNYIPNGERAFQSISLFDIGLVWGEMAEDEILDQYWFTSAKDLTRRALFPRLKHKIKYPPISWEHANSKFSHTHVIPASPAIMYALIYAKNKKPIRLEGYLVDIYDKENKIAMTSLSRTDKNDTARGGGACEIMYVKRVYVGNKVYE